MNHSCPDDQHDHILTGIRATPGECWPMDDDDPEERNADPDSVPYRLNTDDATPAVGL